MERKTDFTSPEFFNITLEDNSTNVLEFYINNTGNIGLGTNIKIDEFGFNEIFTLRVNEDKLIKIPIEIPSNRTPGKYQYEINISAGEILRRIPINITVVDKTPPLMELEVDMLFEYGDTVPVSFRKLEDNIGMGFYYVNIINPNGSTEQFVNISSLDYTNTQMLGFYNVTAFGNDLSGNNATTNTTFEVGKKKIINQGEPNIAFGKIKTFANSSAEFISFVGSDEMIKIKLMEFVGTNTTVYIMNDGQLDKLEMGKDLNYSSGTLSLLIKSTVEGNVEGRIRIEVPEYAKIDNEFLEFSAEFVSYDPPKDYFSEWFGGNITCNAHDTGRVVDSYYTCTTKFPITTDISNLQPVSTSEYNLQNQSMTEKVKNLRESLNESNFTTWFWFIIVILFSFYYLVISRILTKTKWKMR